MSVLKDLRVWDEEPVARGVNSWEEAHKVLVDCESLEGDLHSLRPPVEEGRSERSAVGRCYREQKSPNGFCDDPTCRYEHLRGKKSPGKGPGKSRAQKRSPPARAVSPPPYKGSGAGRSFGSFGGQGKGQHKEGRSWMDKEMWESSDAEPNKRRPCATFLRGLCKDGTECRNIHDRKTYRALRRGEDSMTRGAASSAVASPAPQEEVTDGARSGS